MYFSPMTQAHEEFQVFKGPLDNIVGIMPVLKLLEDYVTEEEVAPKSIGIAVTCDDEGEAQAIVTLGFCRDQKSCAVHVVMTRLDSAVDLAEAINSLAEDVEGEVICHDLLSNGLDLYVVFLCEV